MATTWAALTFTGDTAREWRVQYVKPFFDHWLKGGPDPKTPPVLTYATGVNKWNKLAALANGHSQAYLPGGGWRWPPSNGRKPVDARITSAIRRNRCLSSRAPSTWATRCSGSRG